MSVPVTTFLHSPTPTPVDLAVFQWESLFQKVLLISWKYTSLWHDSFWHIPVFLHLRLLLLRAEPPKALWSTGNYGKVSFTKQAGPGAQGIVEEGAVLPLEFQWPF